MACCSAERDRRNGSSLPHHMAIPSKYLASTMDDDVTKETPLRQQGVPPARQWQEETYRPGNVRIYSATITQSNK